MPSKAFITGRVLGPDDTPLPNGKLVFELTGLDTDAVADAVRVPQARVFTLTALSQMPAGAEVFKNTDGLLGTAYQMTALWVETEVVGARTITRSRQYRFPFVVRVGSADSYTIDDLIAQSAGPFTVGDIVYPTLASAVTAAQAGAAAAAGSAASAVASANIAGAQIYASAAAGIAAVAVNAIFYVPLTPSGGLDIRQKTGASTSVSIGQFLPPTQSQTDTTAGRLLKVQDFGLGAAVSPMVADLNAATVSGFYSYGAAAANKPFTNGGALVNISSTAARTQQIAQEHNSGRIAVRYLSEVAPSSGVWTPWREMFTQGTIIGAVSQSAGIPTGSIIESNTNANGRYVRYADGTLICAHDLTATAAINVAHLGGFRSVAQTWTFPSAFAAAPVVIGSPGNINSTSVLMPSATATNVAVHHTAVASQASASLLAEVMAIGRWF